MRSDGHDTMTSLFQEVFARQENSSNRFLTNSRGFLGNRSSPHESRGNAKQCVLPTTPHRSQTMILDPLFTSSNQAPHCKTCPKPDSQTHEYPGIIPVTSPSPQRETRSGHALRKHALSRSCLESQHPACVPGRCVRAGELTKGLDDGLGEPHPEKTTSTKNTSMKRVERELTPAGVSTQGRCGASDGNRGLCPPGRSSEGDRGWSTCVSHATTQRWGERPLCGRERLRDSAT